VKNNWVSLILPQLFTWASLSVDTLIAGVLVYNLSMKKQNGLPQRAEHLLNNLIRTAFETCAIPWFVVLFSSLCGAVAFAKPAHTRPLYWASCGEFCIRGRRKRLICVIIQP
jgi:hypothetical protein